jgi:hypothetical protein
LPTFLDVESRVFSIRGTNIYIGKEKVTDQLRSSLRDEAKNLQTTRLWEILNASVINEAYNLALIQSTNMEHVQFAKAMHHWSKFMLEVIHILSKQ